MAVREYIAEIDHAELVVRILEAIIQRGRPAGKTAQEVIALTKTQTAGLETVETADRIAIATMAYVAECVEKMQRVS